MKDYIPTNTEEFELDNGSKYKKITKIINAPILQANIVRNFLNIEKVTTPVIPQEQIKLCSGQDRCKNILKCSSILIHHGNNTKSGHYTCMFKYHINDQWYHYDDINNQYISIGTFDNVLQWRNGYVTKNLISCLYV